MPRTIEKEPFKIDLRVVFVVCAALASAGFYYATDHNQIYVNKSELERQRQYDNACEIRLQETAMSNAVRDSDTKHIKETVDDIKKLLQEKYGNTAGL